MKVAQYEKQSIRIARAWAETAAIVGCHPIILRAIYIDSWFCMNSWDFRNLIKRDDKKFIASLKAEICQSTMTIKDIAAKEKSISDNAKDNDDCDLLNYELKQIIEIGDEIVSDENNTFTFSKKKYQTRGKKYRITELRDGEDISSFIAITNADIEGETLHFSQLSVISLWREGKEIWNWNLAYLEQFKRDHPNHHETEMMIKKCTEAAVRSSKGFKSY